MSVVLYVQWPTDQNNNVSTSDPRPLQSIKGGKISMGGYKMGTVILDSKRWRLPYPFCNHPLKLYVYHHPIK